MNEKPRTIRCDARDLQLFLARKDKGHGVWLTQLEAMGGMSDCGGYKHLEFPDATLKAVGLASEALVESVDAGQDLRKDNNSWECRCVLPPPDEDTLLHLTMTGGGLVFRPFEKSLSTVMSKVQPIIHYEITDQHSNDEKFLEELTTSAFVLASHAGGVGGVAFPRVLGELLFELGVSERNRMVKLLQDVEKAGWTQIVPFLSPPHGKWPIWLNDSPMRLDNLVRSKNGERVDFRVTSDIISGGCKDYRSDVLEGYLKDILMRVPTESKIHLVVTNTNLLQNRRRGIPPYVDNKVCRKQISIGSQKDRRYKKLKG